MLALSTLREVPDELANRMMVAHGSRMLLRALRGEAEPTDARAIPSPKTPYVNRRVYVPVAARKVANIPEQARQIIDGVAAAFGFLVDDLMGNSRVTRLVVARAVAFRLLRDRTYQSGECRHSLPQIARYFNRDHSTVSHALDQFDIYARRWPEVGQVYNTLRETLP